ncbi:serine/threonine-protein kinase [Nocardia asteroides]|uniref:serine/threonine-protein kinase n=1 Tax=Nocardia asteroides TaxID=1824 RepID=UPI001E32A0BC|nr:serine/threonine-protein kinase [Nocardia asteroides]UGT60151.1 protein kinase [Nocardia asteroides]
MAAARFGRYRLDRLLGSGGMGQVWLAHDTEAGRRVALKLLSAELTADETYRRRFEREARVIAGLDSPHIVPIHSHGAVDGRLYIEMAYVDGTDLGARLASGGPLPPGVAVAVITQVARALDCAHTAGLVHRDVKPSNIVVRPDGFAVLIDFGIAHGVGHTQMTTAGMAIGTWAYMAPERFSGSADARADVYSLACVFYECLTGRRPFGDTDPARQMHGHLMTVPPSVAGVPGVPAAFDAVIARGLAKEPGDRYPSAGEFAADAVRLLPGSGGPMPTLSMPVPGPTPTLVATRYEPPRVGAAGAAPAVAAPAVAAPVVAGPVVAGPVVAGPVVAGPVVAGPVVAGPPSRGAANAAPRAAGRAVVAPPRPVPAITPRPAASGYPVPGRAVAPGGNGGAGNPAPERKWYLRRPPAGPAQPPANWARPLQDYARSFRPAGWNAVRPRRPAHGPSWPSRGGSAPAYPAAPPAQAPRRRRKRGGLLRRLILATIVIVIAPFAVAAGCLALIAAGTPDEAERTPPTVQESLGPARDGKFEFLVTKVESGVARIGLETASGAYTVVRMDIRNISDEPKWYTPFGQKLIDSTGQAHDQDTTATAWHSTQQGYGYSFELAPAGSGSTILVFDLPSGTAPAYLELHDFAFSDGVTVGL